jgi:hypothetical protein
MSDEGVTTLAALARMQSLGLAICTLDESKISLRMVGADDPEEWIESRRLRLGGTESGDALPHLDPLGLGASANSAGDVAGLVRVDLGLGHDECPPRLMRNVASRPRWLGLLGRSRPDGRSVIAQSAFLLSRMPF